MFLRRYLPLLILLTVTSFRVGAQARDDQFKRDPFSQTYADTTGSKADSTQLFSFREYFGGLAHKRHASLKTLTMGSTVFLGGTQIYNRQYWKLPLVYGGVGAGIGFGIHYNNLYKQQGDESFKKYSTYAFAAAGLTFWASLMDGAVCYERDGKWPNPAKSTVYSILLPGLGQVYNGEYWKVPLYWGMMAGGVYFYATNKKNYQRFKWIYDQATSEDPTVEKPPIPAETALYYRDAYRRLRDYSVLATALFYILQVIDANVFAYMQDFEVSDQLTLQLSPTVFPQQYASAPPAVGINLGLRF